MPDYDAIIIGAGHNGLTCAGYLARAGLKVKVLERRPVVGGAAVTEEFHPGFRNSVYAYAVSLLHPEVIRDLDLHRHGLEIIERPAGTLSLLDGDQLLLSRDAQQARSEVARFSARDADRFGEYEERIGAVALTLRELALNAPPDFGGGWRNALRLLRIGNRLRKLGRAQRIDLAELMTKSLGDYLDSWFESDALKGILGLECAIGNFVDPYQGGTAYVLLHHAFGEVSGRIGAWGHARGGMGAISQAMAAFAASQGADIETSAPVREILVRAGRACGVVTGDGETVSARVIAGNLHPQRLLTELLDPALLPTDTRRRIDAYRSHSATFRMNVALSRVASLYRPWPTNHWTFSQGPSKSVRRSATCATHTPQRIRWAGRNAPSSPYGCPPRRIGRSRPRVAMWRACSASTSSATCRLEPLGTPFGNRLPITSSTPSIATRRISSRRSLAVKSSRRWTLSATLAWWAATSFMVPCTWTSFFRFDQSAGWADYRMPVKDLYLCGSGAHPGGGVSGLPGRNAAKAMLRHLR